MIITLIDGSELSLNLQTHIPEPIIYLARSGGWYSLREKVIEEDKVCLLCNRTVNLEVHHIKPFHLNPELELERSNLITLCRRDHFIFGHKCNWKDINPNVVVDIAKIKECERDILKRLSQIIVGE